MVFDLFFPSVFLRSMLKRQQVEDS